MKTKSQKLQPVLWASLKTVIAERDQLRAEVERLRSDLVALEECHDDNCRAVVKIAAELTAVTAERDQLRLDCDNESKWAAHYLELFIANRDRADKAEEQFRILKKTFDHVTNMYDATVTRAERAEHKLRVRCVSFVTPKKSRNK